jgi:hypothetical protein
VAGGVPVAIVHVVDVIAVLHGLVTATVAVLVRVSLMLHMSLEAAFIPMPVVGVVGVTIVEVIGVVRVLYRNVAAFGTVLVWMPLVDFMGSCHESKATRMRSPGAGPTS